MDTVRDQAPAGRELSSALPTPTTTTPAPPPKKEGWGVLYDVCFIHVAMLRGGNSPQPTAGSWDQPQG